MLSSMERMLDEFIRGLEGASPCSSVFEAHSLVCSKLLEVNERNTAPEAVLNRIKGNQLSAEHGWINVEGDPCFQDFGTEGLIRVSLHRNGTIVVQRMHAASPEVLFVQLGVDSTFQPSETVALT